jgi:hypothetical protein
MEREGDLNRMRLYPKFLSEVTRLLAAEHIRMLFNEAQPLGKPCLYLQPKMTRFD